MPPMSCSEKLNLRTKKPLMAAPMSGSKGTSQMYLYILVLGLWSLVFCTPVPSCKDLSPKTQDQTLPFQQINLVDPDRFLVPVERDHNSQTYSSLSRGHNDDKDGEYLTSQRVRVARFLQIS